MLFPEALFNVATLITAAATGLILWGAHLKWSIR